MAGPARTPLQTLVKRGRGAARQPAAPGPGARRRRVSSAQPWPSPLREGLPALLARSRDRRIVALASGDPLVSGIGTTLVDLLGADAVRIHPAPSSVALARARMGWSDELVRGDPAARRRRRPGAPSTFPGPPADRAVPRRRQPGGGRAAAHARPGTATAVLTVLGDLGTRRGVADRRASRHRWTRPRRPSTWSVSSAPTRPGAGPVSLVPGLPDDAYDHDGQLTKRDLRASALARLTPRPGELLWDVGAGAGSVAIEWSAGHPTCRAIAVEQRRRTGQADRGATPRDLGVPGTAVRGQRRGAPTSSTGCPAGRGLRRRRVDGRAARPRSGRRCGRAAGWSCTRSPRRPRLIVAQLPARTRRRADPARRSSTWSRSAATRAGSRRARWCSGARPRNLG